MRVQIFLFCLCVGIVSAGVLPRTVAGDLKPKSGNTGALVVCGGGSTPTKIIERFVELAGGKQGRLVIIPTAGSDRSVADTRRTIQLWKSRGIGTVDVLHTRDRKRANEMEFVQPLQKATAVWFPGGQQYRLAAAYSGTKVEREVKDVFRRGGVVGGTSAGAAIQSRVMIESGRDIPKISTGFDLLPQAIIDQHFLRRSRLNRLLYAVRKHPKRIGLGIDEGNGIIVRNGMVEVVGGSYVLVVVPPRNEQPLQIHSFSGGSRFRWKQFTADSDARNQ
ncbi:MAG: cyanophycinase [Gemmataceae bacterium]